MCKSKDNAVAATAATLIFSVAFGIVGCGEDPYAQPKVPTNPIKSSSQAPSAAPASDAEKPKPAKPTPPSIEESKSSSATAHASDDIKPSGARVFVDVSGSMQGFVRFGRDLAIESLHLSVGHALSKAGVGPVDYCDVGAASRTRCSLPADPKRYRKAEVYTGASSQMSAVLAKIPKTAQLQKDLTIPVGALDERHVAVVITDGIEVAGKSMLTDGEVAAGCLPGLDTYCLQRVLVKRAEEGYGIWLHALSLPFDGRVFPERGMDKAMYASVNAHLTALRAGPGPFSSLEGKGMRITAPGYDRGKADGYYRFEGVRPLLVIVMSRDFAAGLNVSNNLHSELKTLPIERPAGRYEHIQLAPHEAPTIVFDKRAIALNAKTDIQGSPRAIMRAQPTRVKGEGLRADVDCEADGAGDISFGITTAKEPRYLWPAGFSIIEEIDTSDFVEIDDVLGRREVSSSRTRSFWFKCRKVQSGRSLAVSATVKAGLAFQPPALDDQKAWWHVWTGPDTFSRPELMYRLSDLVEAVLATNRKQLTLQDRLMITITRKAAAPAP